MKYETLIAKKDYEKLYYFLKDNSFSEAYLTKLRQNQDYLYINDCFANMRSKVKSGDVVKFALDIGKKTNILHCDIPLNIIFEDDYFLIVNKPSSLPSTPTKSHYNYNLAGAVCNYMKNKNINFTYRILNRLDKDTCGLVVIAKNQYVSSKVSDMEKTYEAICTGKIDKKITINTPILTESNNGINNIKRIASPLGKEATTFVTPLKYNENYSHIRLKLIHGRTHQIRVHLSSIGHALVGDCLYGKASDLISHTALICKEISFTHPITNLSIKLQANYEEDFKKLLYEIS